MPWAKTIVGVNKKVTQIKCKVCSDIDGKDRLLVTKLDSLWKHVGQRLATIAFVGVLIGDIYFLETNQHMINEKFYMQRGKGFVLQQIAKRLVVEQKKN